MPVSRHCAQQQFVLGEAAEVRTRRRVRPCGCLAGGASMPSCTVRLRRQDFEIRRRDWQSGTAMLSYLIFAKFFPSRQGADGGRSGILPKFILSGADSPNKRILRWHVNQFCAAGFRRVRSLLSLGFPRDPRSGRTVANHRTPK